MDEFRRSSAIPSQLAQVVERDDGPYDISFGEKLSYGTNGRPTITITKTLYAQAATTSTSYASSSATASQGMATPPLLHFSASPFIGVEADRVNTDGTVTATSIGLFTSFNTYTVTRTSSRITTPLSPSFADFGIVSSGVTRTKALSTLSSPSNISQMEKTGQPGKVAGSVIGTFAAFGMIGFFLWYFCVKEKGTKEFNAGLNLRRRESVISHTSQLEDQSRVRTRVVMPQNFETSKSRDREISAFLTTSSDHSHSQATPLSPYGSSIESLKTAVVGPSPRIGIAMSTSTPPNTPPLGRSFSQKSQTSSLGYPASHPVSLISGFVLQHASALSLKPSPLKSLVKFAPIRTTTTSPCTSHLGGGSPLSPKAVLNALGRGKSRAWRRASQALSPSAYQNFPPDGYAKFESPRRGDSTKTLRNPEMEIGEQSDGRLELSGIGNETRNAGKEGWI